MANSKEEVNVSKMYKEDCLSSKEEFMNKNNVKETGLSSKEANIKLHNNGYNEIKKGKSKNLLVSSKENPSLFCPFIHII